MVMESFMVLHVQLEMQITAGIREFILLASLKIPSWSNFWYGTYISVEDICPKGEKPSRNFPTLKYIGLAILFKKISPRQPENLEKDRKTHVQLSFNHKFL